MIKLNQKLPTKVIHINHGEQPENRFDTLSPLNLSKTEQDYVIELALQVIQNRIKKGAALTSPDETRKYLQVQLAELKNEVFGCIFLDNKHRVLSDDVLFHGTVDGAAVYPRVVVQKAMDINAAAVVFYHNHPAGISEPSHADKQITGRLKDALSLVDVRVLDHFVVGREDTTSLAEVGLL